MKQILGAGLVVAVVIGAAASLSAQSTIDDERMRRDLEIAENILSTLIKQTGERRYFLPLDVKASYMPGFGVTFRLPAEFSLILLDRSAGAWSDDLDGRAWENREGTMSYSFRTDDEEREAKVKEINVDSARDAYNQRLIDASKTFIVDYGDLISQLAPNERILITNRGAGERFWFGRQAKKTYLSVEALKSDISDFRAGRITRDQMMKKIDVVSAEAVVEEAPDLELLSTIFDRLYREDLSDTYFRQEGIYFERLKDFGVIYYMKVYSSRENENDYHSMPTLGLSELSKEERDARVKELYPGFERGMKENMVEYGRTLKSLGPDESLVFNVEMTRCEGCGIPATLELSVKNSVLSDYSTGKLTLEAAVAKVEAKKGPLQ